MHLFSILASGILASTCASAYRISLYSDSDYAGRQSTFTTDGSHEVGFTAKSWIYEDTFNDGCCIVFCRGSTNVGRFCSGSSNSDSSAGTTKVVTGCNDDVLNC